MKLRMMVLSLGLLIAAVEVCVAQNPNIGTWKLNEAKSKFSAGALKNHTVVYQAVGDSVKITVTGTEGDGKPRHNEWTGKFDGKDYAVTGDASSDMRSYKQVNDLTLTFTDKKAGKATVTGRVVVSADGRTRTVTTSVTDAKGKKVSATAVYDKQ